VAGTRKEVYHTAQERQNIIKAFVKTGEYSSIVYMRPGPQAITGMKKVILKLQRIPC